jgi:hypothetical protein
LRAARELRVGIQLTKSKKVANGVQESRVVADSST